MMQNVQLAVAFSSAFYSVLAQSPNVKNIVEAYVVIDNELCLRYMSFISPEFTGDKRLLAQENIRKDVLYALAEVNKLLSTLRVHGLHIELRLRKLDYLTTDILMTDIVNGTRVAKSALGKVDFQNWLIQQKSYATYNYDHAILFTGSNIYGDSGVNEISFTNFGSICDSLTALTIAEFQGTYRDVTSLAHALGFALGASNDDANSTYIMSPYSYPSLTNRWSYSSTTAAYIILFINQLSPNCLLTTNSQSTRLTVSYGTYTGDELNPDIVCQRALGTTQTSFCRILSPLNGDAVCSEIYCRVPGTMTCDGVYPSDGMPCDKQKRCNSGKCEPDSTPATQNLDSNCVWNDQSTLELPSVPYIGSCPGFLTQDNHVNCYVTLIQQQCCDTCKQYYTGSVGCEYGDRSLDCVKHLPAAVCPTYKDTLCCHYCSGFVGKRSVPDDVLDRLNITVAVPVDPRHVHREEQQEKISGRG